MAPKKKPVSLVKFPTKAWSTAERKKMISLVGGKVKIQASLFEHLLPPDNRRRDRMMFEIEHSSAIPSVLKSFIKHLENGDKQSITAPRMQRLVDTTTRCMNPGKVSLDVFFFLENLRLDMINVLKSGPKH